MAGVPYWLGRHLLLGIDKSPLRFGLVPALREVCDHSRAPQGVFDSDAVGCRDLSSLRGSVVRCMLTLDVGDVSFEKSCVCETTERPRRPKISRTPKQQL
jgi:hypothetical protein